MPTITIPRSGVTAEEITASLRAGLADHYNVLPGMRSARKPMAGPESADSDNILVGTGSNKIFKAQLTIEKSAPGVTRVRISPGGLGWETIVNSFGISRKVQRILIDAFVQDGPQKFGNAGRPR